MYFLRFGEIPKNEKSINFLKMTNDQNDNFTYALDVYGYNEALECVPECAYEKGVSCFGFKTMYRLLILLSFYALFVLE